MSKTFFFNLLYFNILAKPESRLYSRSYRFLESENIFNASETFSTSRKIITFSVFKIPSF